MSICENIKISHEGAANPVTAKMWRFLVSVAKHWGSLVTGGIIIGIISIWQNTGHAVQAWVYWLVAIVAFIVACYKAWSQQVEEVESLRAELENPSKLVISQKKDPGYYDNKRQGDGRFFIFAAIIISNQSNKANSVVQYEALIMKTDMSYTPIKLEQGETENFEFSVIPVNIPAFNTVETMVGFFDVAPQRYGQPFKMKITAIDMYGKRFTTDLDFSKPAT
jgi:hypothetical protein